MVEEEEEVEEEGEEEPRRTCLDLVFKTLSPPPSPLSARSAQWKLRNSDAEPRRVERGAKGCPQGKFQEDEEKRCRR